jgi:hypothetical protein
MRPTPFAGIERDTPTTRSASGKGSPRSMAASTTPYIVAVSPMPSAIATTAVSASQGVRRSDRTAKRRSFTKPLMQRA